jgi:hypothetical protein
MWCWSGWSAWPLKPPSHWARTRTTMPLATSSNAGGQHWVRFALDDAGAGHGGLSSSALLRAEYMKVDMGLVRGRDTDRYGGRG